MVMYFGNADGNVMYFPFQNDMEIMGLLCLQNYVWPFVEVYAWNLVLI